MTAPPRPTRPAEPTYADGRPPFSEDTEDWLIDWQLSQVRPGPFRRWRMERIVRKAEKRSGRRASVRIDGFIDAVCGRRRHV